jgi:serine/threonine-protein kinase
VAGLNREHFAGRSDWRLPTAPELLSLLNPTPHGEDFCVQPAFDRRQRTLWSCDRRSFRAAWFVDLEMGFAAWRDFSAGCWVRAVTGSE